MSLSVKMYIISDSGYILQRTSDDLTEYFFCTVPGTSGRTASTKGVRENGRLVFQKEDFCYEITFEDLEKLESRILD